MQEAWRWFSTNNPVPLNHIRQSGANNIVSALHNIPVRGDLDKSTTNLDYTGIGHLKGLAELRCAIAATEYLV